MDENEPIRPASSPQAGTDLIRLAARVTELEQQISVLQASLGAAALSPAASVPLAAALRRPPLAPSSRPRTAVPPPPAARPEDMFPQREHGAPPPARPAQKSLEDRLGSQIFNLIGIVALIFGSAWALKLAIENGWIGVIGRVVIGLGAGAGLVLWSELFRRKGLAAFSYSLKAVGTGVLYLSLWAAFQLYHLLPGPVALGAMILVTAWNAFMAFSQDAELLAAYALVGGLLTPLLLSTGGDHETFLFTYLGMIDLAVIALQRTKPWWRLLIPAFLATIVYFIGYYVRFFHSGRIDSWNGQSTETALFGVIFFGLFALVSTRFWTPADPPQTVAAGVIVPVLLPLANAAFLACVLYSVFEDSGLHSSLAWLMVVLAALYLGLMQLQKTSAAAAVHLAVAVVFLTIAIPLKASGQSLTTAWLVEGLVLYWVSTRFNAENSARSRVLLALSGTGYVLGLVSVIFHWTWHWANYAPAPFFNANLGSALVAVFALSGAAWLSRPRQERTATRDVGNHLPVLLAALCAVDAVALLLTLRELVPGTTNPALHQAFANSDFATALVGLILIGATSYISWRTFRFDPSRHDLFRLVAAFDLVLFNLVAILAVEREIGALWTREQAGLQRSLAISGFLMAYGATLLAVGFWRRNAFVRWQALLLILFTIAKVFLYDISGLSAGYRVASFLALGALLLTVSFAYQRDWLGLKQSSSMTLHPDGDEA